MIQSAKQGILGVWGNAEVNDKVLGTVIVGVESVMNSRPLTHVSGDLYDEPVLTPHHFLIGQIRGELALESVDYTSINPRNAGGECRSSFDRYGDVRCENILTVLGRVRSSFERWTRAIFH